VRRQEKTNRTGEIQVSVIFRFGVTVAIHFIAEIRWNLQLAAGTSPTLDERWISSDH
jgi:hypothetical protein